MTRPAVDLPAGEGSSEPADAPILADDVPSAPSKRGVGDVGDVAEGGRRQRADLGLGLPALPDSFGVAGAGEVTGPTGDHDELGLVIWGKGGRGDRVRCAVE